MKACRKTLSFSDMQTFLESPEAYLNRINNGYQRGKTPIDHIGESVHAVAAASLGERDQVLRKQLSLVKEEEREQLEKIVRERVNSSESMAAREGQSHRKKEQLIKYLIPGVMDWTLVAVPDEIAEVDDGFGGKILQITDLKNAFILKERHKRQLFFFGMVLCLALGINKPIKLVVRLLGSGRSIVFWYSPKMTERKLAEVCAVIQRIEKFLEAVEKRHELPVYTMDQAA